MITLQEAYDMLKANAHYSSGQCEGFVYLSQIRELLEAKPKYNQELIDKVHNREAVIEVDDFTIIKDLINFMYPDDPYLESVDEYDFQRTIFGTSPICSYPQSEYYGKYYWFSNFLDNNREMETKPRIKASEFIVK